MSSPRGRSFLLAFVAVVGARKLGGQNWVPPTKDNMAPPTQCIRRTLAKWRVRHRVEGAGGRKGGHQRLELSGSYYRNWEVSLLPELGNVSECNGMLQLADTPFPLLLPSCLEPFC